MGWASMNRYWLALHAAQLARPGLQCFSPLRLPSIQQPAAARWHRVLDQSLLYPLKVRLIRAPVVHLLDHSFAALLKHVRPGTKIIATVHDLIPLLDSTGLTPAQVQRFRNRVSHLRLADEILAISEFTAESLRQFLPDIPDSKISVLPMGTDAPQRSILAPEPATLLSIGSTLERKNLRILPAVLRHLQDMAITPKLIRIGQKLPDPLAAEIVSIIGSQNLRELGFVPEQQLRDCYARATLTFFPSTLEGFGLPVLEAMAQGCPVVCSNASSIPEVAGSAARMFSPDDALTAAQHIADLIDEPHHRAVLVTAGLERAASMTWDHHWQGLQQVYQRVLHSR
jgi:glycosyltransferase involved in cell wall biosynthesis